MLQIDTDFNFYSDSNGGDPDNASPTLRRYHKILWSKRLPNGEIFELICFDLSRFCTIFPVTSPVFL